MKLKRLEIENFVLIEKESLEFDDNLFFISGRNNVEPNQDSNGAGKSLLTTSIVWGLFEENLRKGMSRDDVIGDFGDECRVLLEFELSDGKEVVVERTRGSSSGEVGLFVNGNDRSHPTSKRKTTKRILDVFGIPSKEVFYQAAFQEDTKPPLVSLTPSELKQVVSDILDIGKYDDWASSVRSKKREANSELRNFDDLVRSQESQVSLIKDQISDLATDIEDFDDKREKKINSLTEDLEYLESEIENLEEDSLLSDEEEIKHKLEEQKEKKDQYEARQSKLESAKREAQKAKDELKRLKNKAKEIKSKRDQAKENLENLTSNPSGRCNVCGNYLKDSDKIDEKIEKFQSEKDKYQSEFVDVKYNFNSKKKEYKRKKKAYEQLESDIGDKKEELSKFYKLKNMVSKIEDSLKPKLEELRVDKEDAESKLEKWKNKSVDEKEEKLENKKKELKEEKKELKDLKDRKEALIRDVKVCYVLDDALKSLKIARYNSFMLKFEKVIQSNLDELTGGDYSCSIEGDGDEVEMLFTNSSKDSYLDWHIFSKGERKRISKAVFMALNQMMDLDFIVDDEGVDGIDDGSVKEVIDFILRDDKMVFLASHRNEAKDYCRNSTNLHVEKNLEDGQVKSTIYVN